MKGRKGRNKFSNFGVNLNKAFDRNDDWFAKKQLQSQDSNSY